MMLAKIARTWGMADDPRAGALAAQGYEVRSKAATAAAA
jgi:hypothetical protein